MGKIFISYRRSDSKAITDRVYAWLAEQFGRDSVFYDIDTIGPGVDWRAHIREELEKARVVLAIISGSWLAEMQARAADPQDVLRFELETALARGLSVVPVLIERTEMPLAAKLPSSLARLPDFNAATVHEARYFFTDMEALAERLSEGWGFERRMAAPATVGKARPATAELVVPSTYRGPALPPPKQGEIWKRIELPKKMREFWEARREYFGAAWLEPDRDNCRLALFNRARLGFFDFRNSEFNVYRPFGFWPLRNFDVTIEKLAAHGDEVIFACREGLFKGGAYAASAIVKSADQIGICDANNQAISLKNAKGWWAHIANYYDSRNMGNQSFCDIYQGVEKLARVSATCGNHSIDSPGSLYWSPTGDYAITAGRRVFRNLITCKTIEDVQVIDIYSDGVKSEGVKEMTFPSPCTNMYCRPAWHPAKDVFALATYRRVADDRVSDWHIAIYDADALTLLHSFVVDETRQPNVIAWNCTGRYLATGGEGRSVFVCDLLTGQIQKLFGHSGPITHLGFSPDGQRLLSSGERQCIIWNPETGERVAGWEGGVANDRIREGPWSPDASMVATDDLQVRRLVV